MKQKLERNIAMTFRVTEKERDMIRKRQEQTEIRNMRSYLLKMAIDDRVIIVDSDSVNEMNRLLSNVSNNINQITKRVNQTDNIYRNDLEEINKCIEEVWVQQKDILKKFNKILDVAYEVKKYKKSDLNMTNNSVFFKH